MSDPLLAALGLQQTPPVDPVARTEWLATLAVGAGQFRRGGGTINLETFAKLSLPSRAALAVAEEELVESAEVTTAQVLYDFLDRQEQR